MHRPNSLGLSSYSKGLGEIALATSNIEKLRLFYKDRIGLELIRDFHDGDDRLTTVFFKLAEGHNGHTQVLALFRPRTEDKVEIVKSSLHHFAINIDPSDYHFLKHNLQEQKLLKVESYHEWVNWSFL